MKKLTFSWGLMLLAVLGIAQDVDSINQNKYWVYRDRFRKHFTHIGGIDNGESLPMDVIRDSINCGDIVSRRIESGDVMAAMGEYLGVLATEYKLLKETDDYERLEACKNELYYALNAIDRVDEFADMRFFGGSNNTRGFFVRDDTPKDFYKYWYDTDGIEFHGAHTTSGFIPDSTIVTGSNPINFSDGETWLWANNTFPLKATDLNWAQVAPRNGFLAYKTAGLCSPVRDLSKTQTMPDRMTDNEMSQDHALGILLGMYFIVKYIDDDSLFVQPTSNDSGFYIVPRAIQIAKDVMGFMASTSVNNGDVFLFENRVEQPDGTTKVEGFTEIEFNSGNYVLINPVTGQPVKRGWEAFGMSEGYRRIGNRITGQNYPTAHINIEKIRQLDSDTNATAGHMVVNYYGNKILNKRLNEGIINGYQWQQVWESVPLHVINNNHFAIADSFNFRNPLTGQDVTIAKGDLLSLVTPQDPKLASYTGPLVSGVDEEINTSELVDDVAMNMLLRLGAATESWNHEIFLAMAETRNFKWFELMYANLNDKEPLLPKSYYDSLLSQASCEGARKWDLGYTYDTLLDESFNIISIDTTVFQPHAPFNKSSVFSLPRREYSKSAWVKGDFNGLDYMLLHNMYRLSFSDTIQNEYNGQGCPCKDIIPDNLPQVNGFVRLTDTLTSIYRFPEYKDYGISIPEYISTNLEVFGSGSSNNKGHIKPEGDLTICNAFVKLYTNVNLHVTSSNKSRPKELRISNGGTLELFSGSTLKVDSFSRVIVEPGGELNIRQNSSIILDKGAILEIRGNLNILNSATFKITPGAHGQGFVRFVNYGETSRYGKATITGQTNAKISISAPYKGHKALEIIGTHPIVLPAILTDTIKSCGILMGAGSSLEVDGAILLQDVTIEAKDSGKQYKAGLITKGQEDVVIKNCDFSDGFIGIHCANYLGSHTPVIQQLKCINFEYGLQVQGLNVNVQGDFINCNNGIELRKVTVGSRINNSKIKYGDYGVFHDAQSSGPLKLVYDNLVDNTFGVYAMNGSVLIQCSTLDSNGDGLYLEHSPFISINENQKAGGNYFKNSNGHVVNGDNGAFVLDLANGHSQFKGNNGLFEGYLMNHSSLHQSGTNYLLSSSYNYWDVFPPYQYDLKYVISNVGKINAANVSLDHSDQYTTESALYIKQTSLCPSYGTGSGSFAQKAAGARYVDSDAQNITNSYYNGETLGDIFEDINDWVYYQEHHYPGFNRARSVMDEPLSNLSKFDEYVLGRLYRTMMECYGHIMYDDTSGIDKVSSTQYLLSTLDDLIAKGNNPADTFWASQNVMITMDKAEVYRISNKRDTALQVLQDKLSYVSAPDDIANINQFICIINSENAVINDQMGIIEAQEYYDCYAEPDSSGTVAYFRDPTKKVEDPKPILEWAPQPNPAETGMEVKFNLKSTRFVSVEVYDLVGHEIDSKPRKRFKKGKNSMYFDVHDWPTGIYFVKLNYDDYSDTKRLIIQRN